MAERQEALKFLRPALPSWFTMHTTVDLLTEIASTSTFARRDLAVVMTRWLAKQLVADQYARLGQAGHDPERKIPLARVFIDLEVEPAGPQATAGMIVAELLGAQPSPLRPHDKAGHARPAPSLGGAKSKPASRRPTPSGHFLLIGGPGQGKSTVGQFLCQLHRAALLRDRREELASDAQQALDAVLHQRAAAGPVVTTVLFPVRIELSRLAAWLATQTEESTVLTFLAAEVQRQTQELVSPADLLLWLAARPFLLVLDGLDEAPASAGRAQMLRVLRAFRVQLGEEPALLLVTTRPQGYGEEFADLQPRRLAALSEAQVLAYASQLVARWFAHSDDEREEVMTRMRSAAADPATARLLRTPLQVTLMAALLHQLGDPPRERWELFERYYQRFYERELRKPGAAPELRTYRALIDAIHRRVGLLLQAESERRGGSEALLTQARLQEVLDALLNEQRVRGDRAALSARLLRLATDRLVFLVEAEDGRFGFEVRALQEFLAAQTLREGSDEDLRQRLRQIGGAAAWRNVVVFLLSQATHTLSAWQTWIANDLCRKLNEAPGDKLARVTLAGSQLALDLLSDGGAPMVPLCMEPLLAHALRLLRLPPSAAHHKLAQLAAWEDEELVPLLRTALAEALAEEESAALGAWVVLVALAERGFSWAAALGDERWPREAAAQRAVVAAVERVLSPSIEELLLNRVSSLPGLLLRKMAQHPEVFGPQDWTDFRRKTLAQISDVPAWLSAYLALESGDDAEQIQCEVPRLDPSPLRMSFQPLPIPGSPPWQHFAVLAAAQLPKPWRYWVWIARFACQADAQTLAQVLLGIAELGWSRELPLPAETPWPLALCLDGADDAMALRALAAQASAGELGDRDAWLKAEARWRSSGLRSVDWDALLGRGLRPTKEIGQVGLPLVFNLQIRVGDQQTGMVQGIPGEILVFLLKIFNTLPASRLHLVVGWPLGENLTSVPREAREALVSALRNGRYLGLREDVWSWNAPQWIYAELLDLLIDQAQDAGREDPDRSWGDPRLIARCLERFQAEPTRVDLMRRCAWSQTGVLPQESEDSAAELSAVLTEQLRLAHYTDPRDRISAALLRLRLDVPVDELDELVSALADPVSGAWAEAFLDRLDVPWIVVQSDWFTTVLLKLLSQLPPPAWGLRGQAYGFLVRYLRARPAALERPGTWERLHLPPPRPQAQDADLAPLHLRGVTLRNLRCFEELSFDLPPRAADAGGWLVLVGENGVGKTTVLRALALACLDPAIATAVLAQMAEQSRVPMLRHSTTPGECALTLTDGRLRVHITRRGDHEAVSVIEEREPRPLLYAYGSRRGSALGGPDRDLPLGPLADVNTLFDGREGLIHSETWLKNRKLAALQKPGGRAQKIYDAIIAVLLKILPGVTTIDVRDDRVWVSGPAVGESPLGGLSDGYLSTAGWVLDLLARFLDRAQQRGWPVDPDFPARMEGLVLIDEVDQHMHPRWQVRILADLRRIFPRLTFAVTTHSPLTLLGAEDGEIVMLRRLEDGTIKASQIDIPKGLRVDQVLTGSWFGLASTLHPEVIEKLDRHRRMLRDGVRASDPGRLALEAELRQQLGSFADTALERLTHEVAAELVDERYPERPPEERRSIKDLLKQRVAERSGKPS